MTRDILLERAEIDDVVAGGTLCSAFAATVDRHGPLDALRWKEADGWHSLSWDEYRLLVRDVSLGLGAVGFRRGTCALVLARNRPEHVIADLAIVHAGGRPVSVYNTVSGAQLSFIARHCEATLAVVEDEGFLDLLLSVRSDIPHLDTVILVDGDRPGTIAWESLAEEGRAIARRHPAGFDETAAAVQADDVATVVYTSGTGGGPKGVVLTHRNVLWALEAVRRVANTEVGERLISFMPLAHAAERWWSHWNGLVHGTTTHFCADLGALAPTMAEVRPTWFLAPPRVWEKLAAGVQARVDAAPADARDRLTAALGVGRQVLARQRVQEPVPADLQDRYQAVRPVLTSILAGIGLDECRVAVSGSAAIAPETLEFFNALGLDLIDGWGMTELTGTGTWRHGWERSKLLTVGRTLPGVEACVAPDGELLLRGGNVMAGYHRDEAATARVIDADGWLSTGDVATIDDDGCIRLVGRKKDIIITAGGKKVAPAAIETRLRQHPLIGQVCVVGEGRPYL
ncbi:MAG TPA: AMP-binding protein, partial [Acidimicrobiales bacterium]|nr:AMP-binding protein [Acidimicrobiales bacterium]